MTFDRTTQQRVVCSLNRGNLSLSWCVLDLRVCLFRTQYLQQVPRFSWQTDLCVSAESDGWLKWFPLSFQGLWEWNGCVTVTLSLLADPPCQLRGDVFGVSQRSSCHLDGFKNVNMCEWDRHTCPSWPVHLLNARSSNSCWFFFVC